MVSCAGAPRSRPGSELSARWRREFALARQAAEEQEGRLARLRADEEAGKGALRTIRQDTIDLVQVRRHEEFLQSLNRRIAEAGAALRELRRIEEEKGVALSEARQAVKVLEKHRERRLEEHARGAEIEERKMLDEVAQKGARRES